MIGSVVGEKFKDITNRAAPMSILPTNNAFPIHYPSVVLPNSSAVVRIQAVRMKLNIQTSVPLCLIKHLSDHTH